MKLARQSDYAVLFVDDEDKALKYFRMAFTKDFPVLTAGSVAQALEVLEAQGDGIGVLITDQRMPGQPGVELLKQARARWPGIVRILTTAYSDLEDAIAAVNRGEILRYVTKPWDIHALRLELRHAMDFFLLRRERDLLLEAKLSVRRQMLLAERLRALIAITGTLENLRGAPAAVTAWVLDTASRTEDPVESSPELWGADVAETLRLARLSREILALDRTMAAGYPDRIGLASLCADAGIGVSGGAPEVRGQGRALLDLLSTLAQSTGAPAAAQLGECALADGAPGASVVVIGPDAGVAEPDRLVRAYLLAWHHGGSLRSTWEPEGPRLDVCLALEPSAVDRPEPDADWLTEQFARLEDWGG
jgi:two-component system probable response regulator PhcQ